MEMLIKYEARPCIVDGERKALFYGFCDNFDKCVVQYEDGELHKAYVWKIRFTDNKFEEYCFN